MKPISRRAEERLEADKPDLVALVRHAKSRPTAQSQQPVQVPLDIFVNNPILLYEWIWLAASNGVAVTILPLDLERAGNK